MSRGRTLGVALGTVLLTGVLTAAPALADNPTGPADGDDPGKSLGPGGTILFYLVLPIVAAIAIGLVVWLPGMLRSSRYRPAKGWDAPPVWFGGPQEPVAAVQTAELGETVRGGASGDW